MFATRVSSKKLKKTGFFQAAFSPKCNTRLSTVEAGMLEPSSVERSSSRSEKRREQSSAVALMLRLRALQSTCFHFWTMSTFMPILDRIFYLYHFSDTLYLWNIISVKLYLWSKSFLIFFENIIKTQNEMRSKPAGTKVRKRYQMIFLETFGVDRKQRVSVPWKKCFHQFLDCLKLQYYLIKLPDS